MNKVELIATTAFGLESIVAYELKKLGYTDLKVNNGSITFKSDWQAIPRCNLWLRSADRLLVKMGEFQALSFEELFEKTKSLRWTDLLPEDAEFPVTGKSIKSKLFSISDCQAIVKKAVVEKMKIRYKKNWFSENGPRYKIEVALLKDVATLTVDTSGAGLHKRGYRKLSAPAPLKETLAAAMISLSRWKPDRPLIDPFCGSGTIPIEAAMIGLNIAPGLNRNFAAENWPQINSKLWKQSREEAQDHIIQTQQLGITGMDKDLQVLKLARYHSRQAGLENRLIFKCQDIKLLDSKYEYGYFISNPPYGERLSEKHEVESLYREMAKVFAKLKTWSFYVLTSHPGFERLVNRKADKKRKLFNGRIECSYYHFFGPRPRDLTGLFPEKLKD